MNAMEERNGQRNGEIVPRHVYEGEVVHIDDGQEAQSLDIQVMTARRFPRSIAKFKAAALEMATLDVETAESCFYALPRSGKTIEGASVRLAEICATAWGHISAGTKVISIGEKEVTTVAVAWDMQTNVRICQETRRRIVDKHGRRYNDDMILMTCNAAASIGLRNALLRVIPRCYVDAVYREARRASHGDIKTLAVRRAAAVEYFKKAGVQEPWIFAALGVKGMDDIGLDQLVTLSGFKTAISDGETSIDECFPDPAKVAVAEEKKSLADKIKNSGKKEEAKLEPKPETPKADEPQPPPPESGPSALEKLHIEIAEHFERIGTSPKVRATMLAVHNAKKITDLTEPQAALLVADLAKVSDSQ